MSEETSIAVWIICVAAFICITVLTISRWDYQQERYMADKGYLYSGVKTDPHYAPALQVRP